MKTFLAVFTGTPGKLEAWKRLDDETRKDRERTGMKAWMDWGTTHAASIVGRTKRVAAEGISDTTNNLAGYIVVKAETHDAAAKIFENHPHFTIFPGDGVEIMECLPIPARG
jgi:transcription antitermination factor NusG